MISIGMPRSLMSATGWQNLASEDKVDVQLLRLTNDVEITPSKVFA